jgi:hypothetical protein
MSRQHVSFSDCGSEIAANALKWHLSTQRIGCTPCWVLTRKTNNLSS